MSGTAFKSLVFAMAYLGGLSTAARSADIVYQEPAINMVDPTPVAQQRPAVDGINFKVGAVTGVVGDVTNHMFIASVATPMPFFNSFGAQLDLGIGMYDHDYTSAAAGLHLFYRDPERGMFGIYGDWGYINPEHAGRVGVEASLYNGRWSLDVLAGVQFGQHVRTDFIDEVDVSYYFTDNFKGSIGHRLIARGHVANVGFEFMPDNGSGWSLYGEAEVGEDDYQGAWLGVRYSFGQASANSLIERDRTADPIIRIPRNLATLSRCGTIQNPANFVETWNGFETHPSDHICSDNDDLNDLGAIQGKLGDDPVPPQNN